MKYIDLYCELQTADNGDTTYYGGVYSARPSTAHPLDDCEFYFHGSDRETSPLEIVSAHMHDWYGIHCPDGFYDDSRLAEAIDEAIQESTRIRLYLDDELRVTMIEPI